MEAENQLIAQRAEKIEALQEAGVHPFPNDFRTEATCREFRDDTHKSKKTGHFLRSWLGA